MAVIRVNACDFAPTASQARFLASRARVVAFVAGYGSGKTRVGGEKALDLVAANPGCDGMIVAPTWGILHKVTLRAFFDPNSRTGACPRQLVREHVAGKRYLQLVNGARVYYGSADRPGTLEGANLAWWGMDEPRLIRPEAFRVLLGRLRDARARQLQAFITGTPSAGWLQAEFGAEKPDREVIHGSTRENAHNLAPGFIEDLERTYSARQARVLIDGEFGLLDGTVYEFERAIHLVNWEYDPRLLTVAAIDFGYQRPAVVFLQHVPHGRVIERKSGQRIAALSSTWVAFDELVPANVSTETLCRLMREKGYRIDAVYCDPAGDGAQLAYGVGDVQVLKDNGFATVRFVNEPRFRHIPYGVALLQGMLKNARGETRLYVSAALDSPRGERGLVKDFERYHYPEVRDGRPTSDKPEKDGVSDHTMDAIRYWAINVQAATVPGAYAPIPAL